MALRKRSKEKEQQKKEGDTFTIRVSIFRWEFLKTTTLRVWKYNEANKGWHQIAVMPIANSHGWYRNKVDINYVGMVTKSSYA
ncbi:F-box only protein 13 isoform X1 [Spatholobus suberectus]|nr:F-box only protein 13 isoform X1 [Spatholobus suberectus]